MNTNDTTPLPASGRPDEQHQSTPPAAPTDPGAPATPAPPAQAPATQAPATQPYPTQAPAPAAAPAAAEGRNPARIRVGTVVWGLVLALIGLGVAAVGVGAVLDIQAALIVLLIVAGTALLLGAVLAARR